MAIHDYLNLLGGDLGVSTQAYVDDDDNGFNDKDHNEVGLGGQYDDDYDDDDDDDNDDDDDDGDDDKGFNDKDHNEVGLGGRSQAMSQLRDSLTAAITHCQLSDDDDDDGGDDDDDDGGEKEEHIQPAQWHWCVCVTSNVQLEEAHVQCTCALGCFKNDTLSKKNIAIPVRTPQGCI